MTKVKKKVSVTTVTALYCSKDEYKSYSIEHMLYGKHSKREIEKLLKVKGDDLNALFVSIVDMETKKVTFETTLEEFLNIATLVNN